MDTAPSTNNGTIVDSLVDDDYLQLIEHAWHAVAGHARTLLTRAEPAVDDTVGDAHDSTRTRAVDWLRAAAQRTPDKDDILPTSGPSADAFELAVSAYPGFLAGASTGTRMLFSGDGVKVWQQYYQSANQHYAPVNKAAAAAVATRARQRTPLRILEVGAGTGGATSATLEALAENPCGPVNYLVTDISVRLLKMTEADLAEKASSDIVLEYERFDLDGARPGPRVKAGGFDVVVAVNALHNASDLSASLRLLCTMLKEDGVLILSESICGEDQQVHQEFFLNLLPMPDHRQGHGSRFLSAASWRSAIREAELEADIAINSIGPELVLLATVSAPPRP